MAADREARARVAAALAARPPRRLPESAAEVRAAVALVLRPRAERRAPEPDDLSLLFVRRAERRGDPWSGQMALPGGRREPGDADLAATALRETREETSLDLARGAVLGALDDVHPFTRSLPSVAVTPFVVWDVGSGPVVGNAEVSDHVWIPLPVLRDPAHRSAFTLRREQRVASFPTIEFREYRVWGLTFEIVARFLDRLRGRT